MENRSYSLESAAEKIGIEYRDVCRLIEEGSLSALKIGKMYRVSEKQLHEYKRPKAASPAEFLIKGERYLTDRIILEYDGLTILLFNKKSITLGRSSKSADLPVVYKVSDDMNETSRTVSRKHAEILYDGDHAVLRDHSRFGTYVNGKKMDCHADKELTQDAIIGFGDISWNMKVQQCRKRPAYKICRTCAAKKIKAISFTGINNATVCYLLVWQCCGLEQIKPELKDWSVYTGEGFFFIHTPDDEFLHLSPGLEISAGTSVIKVKSVTALS